MVHAKLTNSLVVLLFEILSFPSIFNQLVSAKPNPLGFKRRSDFENTVVVNGPEDFCLIVPKDANTNIGDSEREDGTLSYCTGFARSSSSQGEMPSNFWTNVEYHTEGDDSDPQYAQLTGCINSNVLDRLNPDDDGGQYDSSGGSEGTGNPVGSTCQGYNHYVELIEPSQGRACIRCCQNEDDCPTTQDTYGCPAVIPGEYFDCS